MLVAVVLLAASGAMANATSVSPARLVADERIQGQNGEALIAADMSEDDARYWEGAFDNTLLAIEIVHGVAREAGGIYVENPRTGELIEVENTSEIIRLE
jgi:hypothetical protein